MSYAGAHRARISGDADMRGVAVVDDPAEVARGDARIQDTVECRLRGAGRDRVDQLGSDEEPAVPREAEVAGHPGAGTVRADEERRRHRIGSLEPDHAVAGPGIPHPQADLGAGRLRRASGVPIDSRHVGHPILVPFAGKPDRCAPRGRVQQHIPYARTEQMLRQVEVVERAPYEDPGRANARRQRPAPLDQQHVQAPLREQASGVQAREAGTHHHDVYFPHNQRR